MLGQTISHYQIKRELGRGGMGVVYLAEDLRLGRQVAIKALPPDVARDPLRRKRFEQEARACAALNHSAIAAVFDLEVSGEDLFIIFEYVDGDDLRALFRHQPLDTATLLRFAQGIGRGLAAAHQAGIVHRDLKPENVRVNSSGEVKILDFGLARMQPEMLRNAATFSMALTQQGSIVGTVGYMSPEQLESRALDARSDIFSLGVILYEMAAGVHPFQGESPASTIANVLAREPAPIGHLNPIQPPALDAIVRKCLAKKKEDRYQNVAELLLDLEDCQRGSGDAMKTVVLSPRTAAVAPEDSQSLLVSVFARAGADVRRWWEIHHLFMTLAIPAVFPYLAWYMRGSGGGQLDLLFFFVVVILAIINFTLRGGMLLSVAFNPVSKLETIARLGPGVALTHLSLCLVVVVFTASFVSQHPLLGTLFAGLVIGGILVTTVIEPWIESRAFPELARQRAQRKLQDEASPNRGARRWWLIHHVSAMLGWTPMMAILPWMVRDWLPQANKVADYIVLACVILALQNFGIRAYVLEVSWLHRDALEATVRKMATPLLVCNLLLAALAATISALLFKTHFPQAAGFAVMAVGATMIVGVLERNFNGYAFPGPAAAASRAVRWDATTTLVAIQLPYIFGHLYLLGGMLHLMDEIPKMLSQNPPPSDLYVFLVFTVMSTAGALVLGSLVWGLAVQRRADVVPTFKRWFPLFAFLDLGSMQGGMLFLARNTNLFVLMLGASGMLYGIRYQWILAKRILAAQKPVEAAAARAD